MTAGEGYFGPHVDPAKLEPPTPGLQGTAPEGLPRECPRCSAKVDGVETGDPGSYTQPAVPDRWYFECGHSMYQAYDSEKGTVWVEVDPMYALGCVVPVKHEVDIDQMTDEFFIKCLEPDCKWTHNAGTQTNVDKLHAAWHVHEQTHRVEREAPNGTPMVAVDHRPDWKCPAPGCAGKHTMTQTGLPILEWCGLCGRGGRYIMPRVHKGVRNGD